MVVALMSDRGTVVDSIFGEATDVSSIKVVNII